MSISVEFTHALQVVHSKRLPLWMIPGTSPFRPRNRPGAGKAATAGLRSDAIGADTPATVRSGWLLP